MKKLKKLLSNKYRTLSLLFLFGIFILCNVTFFLTYGENTNAFVNDGDFLDSGISDNKVIVNDLESDYNYYMGLNYTSSDGAIPTKYNKGIYNDNNLVQVKTTYSSTDILGQTGYVSDSERQNTYVYFNTYYVNNNGTVNDLTDDYIEILLIDNPFTDRPTDQGFNGWNTNYMGVTLSYDSNYYERSAKVPVTYTNNIPNKIDITFNASWTTATIHTSNGSINSITSGLLTRQMKKINFVNITYEYKSMRNYYRKTTVSNWNSLSGYYSNTGTRYGWRDSCNNRHTTWNGSACEVYELINTDENYDSDNTYYELVNGRMSVVTEESLGLVISSTEVDERYVNKNMSPFYRLVNVSNGSSLNGYYNDIGESESGNCNSYNGCDVYELINYYNSNGEENLFDQDTKYYYLVTRDTNLVIVNNNVQGSIENIQNYPLTITGLYNGTRYNSTWTTSSSINIYDDITIENVTLRNNSYANSQVTPSSNTNSSGTLYGRYNNVKIGRGINLSGTNYSLLSIIGGSNSSTGSNNNPTKYKLIIESGKYNSLSIANGGVTGTGGNTLYLNNKTVYGSDYDRVNKDNNKLDVVFCAAGSWGGRVYGNTNSTTSNDIALDLTVKSGQFGSGKSDLTTGIYIGGRYGGTQYTARRAKVEGGYIYNLIGGPISASNRTNYNDIYAYMTGGEIDMITGGAGTSATYGNRIIQVTGGTVNYSVFGGSNGQDGSNGDGTLNGSTYVYIGGNATIGKSEYVENGNTLWGAESGSVFGNGNGNSSYSSIGSCDNSTIVIDGKSLINGNVYGGGNYGATGVSSQSNSSTTQIVINNGIIKGSVFGGGNKNGAGNTSKSATIDIEMNNGVIAGSLYGGSNLEGTIYGSVNINMIGGEISNSLYGGGKGGKDSSTNGTYVRNAININVGSQGSIYTPIINEAIYGGSESGSVNGTTESTSLSSDTTNVVVNKGIINNVFGGGQGNDAYTPYVMGNIFVTINNGTINNVFGGNDKSGKPNGDITVTINGGEIASTYGGGNETSANNTYIYLNGGKSTKVFGGSNLTGEVNVTNIVSTNGEFETIYGGNNKGGTTDTTNVTINGGIINTIYGGGDETSVITSTNVNVNSDVTYVYGGSNMMGDVPVSNVIITNASTDSVYGGNREGGTTNTSNVKIDGGYHSNVFGGGYKAETGTTNVNVYTGGITNLFGAGNQAGANITNVNIGKSSIGNLFGGSNLSGEVNSSYIKSLDSNINDNVLVDVSFDKSSQSNANYKSSQNIKVNITNNGNTITNWDLYIMTSDGVLGANWSSATVEKINNGYHINEKNQYWGTNEINGTYSFDYHVFSNVNYEDFKINNYYFIGYDSNGNKYVSTSKVINLYGGNNEGGTTHVTNNNLTSGTITNMYGGGNKAITDTTNIDISNTFIEETFFGGGNEANVENVNVIVSSCTFGSNELDAKVFGGGNKAEVTNNIVMNIKDNTNINGNIYGGGNLGEVKGLVTLNISDSNITKEIYGAGNLASVGSDETKDTINLTLTNSSSLNVYTGGNAASVIGNVISNINSSNITDSIFGGGNGLSSIVSGDETGEQNPAKIKGEVTLTLNGTTSKNIYGGGNLGLVEKSTNVKIVSSNIKESIYGGGNASIVNNNTNLYVSDSKIEDSVYAGGNGVKALVLGNTNLDVDNNSIITNHVFGGGNAAATGTKDNNNSTGIVNIVGATIGKNVYGGANTSVLYGTTTVNIGINASSKKTLIQSPINIGGTVFGGGEANASGSEIYDFSFISVTKGIDINIDAKDYTTFNISGSIFGSGNASSTEGYSYINIHNYGNNNDIKRNVSIQRANKVILDNSYILLSGAKDRTNEYSDVLFTLSRIDELNLKNSSSLYLETGANLLKKFKSTVDNNGTEEIGVVEIDDETKSITRNVNNRIYMLEGKNLNIAKNENVTEYGEVEGMTFFGMFLLDRNKNIITALYGDYNYDESISSGDIYYFTNGSYVLGKHLTNHDITKNGFYSNYGSEEGNNVVIKYIEPTPQDTDFYMWTIGEVVASYEITLTASKYSTLGAQEIPLINHTDSNTTFSILGVNFSNLEENVKLVDYKDIPRVADNETDADTIFGLTMKNGAIGWANDGSTNFITEGETDITGTKSYIRENINNVPALAFYFYHSKNLSSSGSLGSVTISLVAITRIDDLNNKVERINININLTKALYNTNDYEGTITPGKKYEMFATTETNITSKSSFSTYYSLFMESDSNPYKEGYSRSLVSTYPLPINTKITMIDLHDSSNPLYYYYMVTESDYYDSLDEYDLYREVSYKLSKFVKMGSVSEDNTYDDESSNIKYYDSTNKIADEEFIFTVDFKDSNINEDVLNKTLLIELRNKDEQTLIGVLGIEQQTLKYNLYTDSDSYIGLEGTIKDNNIYLGKNTNLTIDSTFIEQEKNGIKVKDTTFGEEKIGMMISIVNSDGTTLSAQDLFGLSFTYNGVSYYPSSNGITRIKISDKIANIRSIINLDTGTSSLPTGDYKIVINSFGSNDGIYYGDSILKEIEIPIKIIDTPYGLKITRNKELLYVDKLTGITQIGNNNFVFNIRYQSNLNNPNLRIKLQRRNYDNVYSLDYTDVNLLDYIENPYNKTNINNLYLLSDNPLDDINYTLRMKTNLKTGTYRIVISLYDDNTYIGEVYDYMIIK